MRPLPRNPLCPGGALQGHRHQEKNIQLSFIPPCSLIVFVPPLYNQPSSEQGIKVENYFTLIFIYKQSLSINQLFYEFLWNCVIQRLNHIGSLRPTTGNQGVCGVEHPFLSDLLPTFIRFQQDKHVDIAGLSAWIRDTHCINPSSFDNLRKFTKCF